MPTLKMGSTTVLTETSGALTIGVSNPTVTLGSNSTFTDGVCRSMGFLTREKTSGSPNTGDLGGTGDQITPWTNIRDGFIDSNWTNPVLTLSSNYWTMQTGVYYWLYHRTSHQTGHITAQGIKHYGDSNGAGSTVGNLTGAGTGFGSSFNYCSSSTGGDTTQINFGVLTVTSTSQKHGFYNNQDADSSLGYGGMSLSSTNMLIQAKLSFQKLG
jgi:hypothetical protein